MTDNTIPTVNVVALRRASGHWLLVMDGRCPYCGERHVHGGGDGDMPFGEGEHRTSDCMSKHRPFLPECDTKPKQVGEKLTCRLDHGLRHGYLLHIIGKTP